MLSCLLLWPRHSSRQLLCPASRFVQSSFSPLHFVSFAIHHSCSFRLGYESHRYPSHITTNCTLFLPKLTPLHSVSFIPLSLSKLQSTRCHCCARLRLSSGLRAVMLFAPTLCWPTHVQLLSTTNHTQAKIHASPCSCGHCSSHNTFRGLLIVRTALCLVPQLRAPCSHPTSSSRDSLRFSSFALGGSQNRQSPSRSSRTD
jgi:hypothetical protein